MYCYARLAVSLQKQRPKRVKAIYNCMADNADELTFSEGEVIVVDGEEDQEWWVSVNSRLGYYFVCWMCEKWCVCVFVSIHTQ